MVSEVLHPGVSAHPSVAIVLLPFSSTQSSHLSSSPHVISPFLSPLQFFPLFIPLIYSYCSIILF